MVAPANRGLDQPTNPSRRDREKSTLNSHATCLKLVDTLRFGIFPGIEIVAIQPGNVRELLIAVAEVLSICIVSGSSVVAERGEPTDRWEEHTSELQSPM